MDKLTKKEMEEALKNSTLHKFAELEKAVDEMKDCVIVILKEFRQSIIQGFKKLINKQPTLEGRNARCAYYGKPKGRNCGPLYPKGMQLVDGICKSEAKSDYNLPFFEWRPKDVFDKYYCGCFGWD